MIKQLRLLIKEIIKEALGAHTIHPPADPYGEFDPIEIPGGLSALRQGNKGLDSLVKRADDANKKFLDAWDNHHKQEKEIEDKKKRSEELLSQLRMQQNKSKEDNDKEVDASAPTIGPGIKTEIFKKRKK